MDNTSINDILTRTLGILLLKCYGIHFTQENGQIRCIVHVVNLVVQKFLSELFEAEDPMLHDYYEEWNKHLPFHYDPDTDEENQRFASEGLRAAGAEMASSGELGPQSSDRSEAEGEEGNEDETLDALLDGEDVEEEGDLADASGSAIKKLRFIVNKIVSSPQRRAHFQKITRTIYKSSSTDNARRRNLMVVRDVATRWNYTHAMIERAVFLQDAVDAWVSKQEDSRIQH
ncbi:hypothetical protein V8D89_012115 [Ganoderma adspersum]